MPKWANTRILKMQTNTKIRMAAMLPLLAQCAAVGENADADNPPAAAESRAFRPAESKSRPLSLRASEILGTNVKNTKGETVGEVEDLNIHCCLDWHDHPDRGSRMFFRDQARSLSVISCRTPAMRGPKTACCAKSGKGRSSRSHQVSMP